MKQIPSLSLHNIFLKPIYLTIVSLLLEKIHQPFLSSQSIDFHSNVVDHRSRSRADEEIDQGELSFAMLENHEGNKGEDLKNPNQ